MKAGDKAEFELLLGRKLESSRLDKDQELDYNDAISQCRYARGFVARLSYRILVLVLWYLKKRGRRATANLLMMSVYNMPFRGIARMTGGAVSMAMVDGILLVVNGHFFRGIAKFIREWRKNSHK